MKLHHLVAGAIAALALASPAAAVGPVPNGAAETGIAPSASTAAESGRVFKSGPGNLYRAIVTTGATSGFLMVFNATAVPADGAVTPALCRPVSANSTLEIDHTEAPDYFDTGISFAFSSGANCFTKTASATARFEASVK